MRRSNFQNGSGVIEVIIGTAILVGVFTVLGSIARYSLTMSEDANLRIRSSLLASEGIEAVKSIRDRGWTSYIATLTPGTDYYATLWNGAWVATTTATSSDTLFTRRFTIADVSRDASDDIVASGGTNDPNTKKVTVTVTWMHKGLQRQDRISTYITNIFGN